MVERLLDMPNDTLGVRLSGRLTRDEYFEILDPVRERLERGEKVSFLVGTARDFHGLDLEALWEDAKAAGSVGMRYVSSWMLPGETRVFEPGGLGQAKAWVGGAG